MSLPRHCQSYVKSHGSQAVSGEEGNIALILQRINKGFLARRLLKIHPPSALQMGLMLVIYLGMFVPLWASNYPCRSSRKSVVR